MIDQLRLGQVEAAGNELSKLHGRRRALICGRLWPAAPLSSSCSGRASRNSLLSLAAPQAKAASRPANLIQWPSLLFIVITLVAGQIEPPGQSPLVPPTFFPFRLGSKCEPATERASRAKLLSRPEANLCQPVR